MGHLLDRLNGRDAARSPAITRHEKNEFDEKTPRQPEVNSFISYGGTPARAQGASATEAPQATPGEPEPCPPSGWDAADWQAFYDEHAAIREYDGQRPRAEAERLAWGETLTAWHKAHGVPPPAWQCAGCDKPLSGGASMTIWDGAKVHDAPDHACLIAYGRRWRATATRALAALGVEPPQGWEP